MLDIESAIQAIDEKVVNHKNTRRDLLNHFLFPLYYCKIQHLFFFHEEEDAYVPKGTVDFHGRFSEEDEMIHVYIVHNPNDKTYEWHPIIWAYIRSIYIDTIGHELVHRSQHEKRKVVGIADYQRLPNNKEFKCIENDDEAENGLYLILPDEMEANAYNFACQLYRRHRDVNAALDALRKGEFDTIEINDFYKDYIKKNSYVYKRLMKKPTWFLLNKYDENTHKTSECNEDNVENKE